jgi:pheromone shutdown-related protein TraB
MHEAGTSIATPADDAPPVQPTSFVSTGGVSYTLLGTAHVSRASADEVERLISEGDFDAVAVELDPDRHSAIVDPDRWKKLDLFQVFRQGKAGAVMASLALGAFQQRLADQLGIEPGQEMRVAIAAAGKRGLPLLLVDRDIGVTLRRIYHNVPWWRRLMLMSGLLASLLSSDEIDSKEIEKLKEGDILEATFTEFAETSRELYEPLIAERDRYMALRLREEAAGRPDLKRVLVVLGAGHLKGVNEELATAERADAGLSRAELEAVPPPSRWPQAISWLLVLSIIAGFVIGFMRSPDLGLSLVSDWVLITGVLAGLGGVAALAHPVTIVGSALAAPFTTLHPLLGAGMVAAGLELWLRKPTVADFESLRRDVTTVRGWWRNRVARTFLAFLFVSLGAIAGVYLGGARVLTTLLG